MAKKDQNQKKKSGVSQEQKSARIQRIFFGVLAAIIILSWIITLVAVR